MAKRAPFPDNPEEFKHDSRISYSKQNSTYILEDENGEEWEWLSGPSKWTKSMDEELVRLQAEIYKVDGVDDEAPAFDPVKKRKATHEDSEPNKKAKATAAASGIANSKPKADPPRRSTAVFVSGLPDDADVEEVRDVFAKFGMLAESPDDDEKRVKLYNDKDGRFKGEALIIYFRPESVHMAIDMLDGCDFPRDPGQPTSRISISPADNSYKRHHDDTVAEDRTAAYKAKPSKVKTKKKVEEMNSRLADWSDDDVSTIKQTSSRSDKVVVVKHFFTLEELAKDEYLLEELRMDMEEEAEKHGEVKNITLFDLEEDGVVTIRFSNAMAARACANAFDGRHFDKRKLTATISTGLEKFRKTFKKSKDKEEEERKRLEQYSKDIESGGKEPQT